MKRNEYILISVINLFNQCADILCNHTDVNRQSSGLAMNLPPDRYHTKANTGLEESVFFSVILSFERSQVYTFDQFT